MGHFYDLEPLKNILWHISQILRVFFWDDDGLYPPDGPQISFPLSPRWEAHSRAK